MSWGTVTRLSTTPVKGLRVQHPDSVSLTAEGVVGDRMFYLVDDRGHLQSCTHNANLLALSATFESAQRVLRVQGDDGVNFAGTIEPGEPTTTNLHGLRDLSAQEVADPGWHDFFSAIVGKPVRLLEANGPAFDVHPASLVSTGSLADLARHSEESRVDARRFRMLIEFASEPVGSGPDGAGHIEDTWRDQCLRIGDAVLRIAGPVKRCAATTRNPDSGVVDWQTLRMIKGYRGLQETELGTGIAFGVYADVVAAGVVRVGDALVPESHLGSPSTGRP